MTRNIIAEFSCSLDSNGDFKKYEVVTGSVFNDVYNEELDSASIVLAHVGLENRLVNLKQYDFVRVYDERGGLDKVYLVDSFNEREDRITEPRMFSYTIKLMSQTKLLEKIQCPSLTITHEVKNGSVKKRTIFEKICEYMELYVPKVKMYDGNGGWDYQPIIEIPGVSSAGIPVYKKVSGKDRSTRQSFVKDAIYSVVVNIPEAKLLPYKPENIVFSADDNRVVFKSEPSYDALSGNFSVDFTVSETISSTSMYQLITIVFTVECDIFDRFFHGEFIPKPGYEDFYNKFNVSTADLGSSFFTLRQLLTMLMQQVGCIPTVENLKLSYLDFNKIEEEFSVDETINHVDIGASSDSYANTLVNTASNVLDSGNEVVSEVLGFRDSNNVLLKQTSNLFLETKFPIYKVNKFEMNCVIDNSIVSSDSSLIGTSSLLLDVTKSDNKITIKSTPSGVEGNTITIESGEINYFVTFFNYINGKISIVGSQQIIEKSHSEEIMYDDTPIDDFEVDAQTSFQYFLVETTGTLNLYRSLVGNVDCDIKMSAISSNSPLNNPTMVTVDITPLIKESQERSLLLTNFKEMEEALTIEELSKYFYGTVGYTIGSNRIFGFSDTYSQIQGKIFTWTETYTYIENIYRFLSGGYMQNEIRKAIRKFAGINIINDKTISTSLFNPSDFISFTQFTFNIKYQPLNSFNLAYVKKEESIDFPLEQLNSSESGLTDFDRLSINQQETVDRIGNRTLSISQRILPEQFSTKLHPIPSVYSRDGIRNVIFKRTYTVGNYKYDVNYVGSKDAILKNYFTSIRTKYRAYQYVDYNQSVLRKEKDIIYVRIGFDYFDGDDKIKFTSGEGNACFISGIRQNEKDESLSYMCEVGAIDPDREEETIKNDISIISNDNSFAVIYEQPDNISAGPYIASSKYSTYYTNEEEKLGGIPQKWQEWYYNFYNVSHKIYYTSNLSFFSREKGISFYQSTGAALRDIENAAKAPIVNDTVKQIKDGANVFYVVNDNKGDSLDKTFYKDFAERLNHTVQFIYYTDIPDFIKWTENFISNNVLVQNTDMIPNCVYMSDNMNLDKNLHSTHDTLLSNNVSDYVYMVSGLTDTPHIHVIWPTDPNFKGVVKVCHKDESGNVSDIIAFKKEEIRPTYTDYYVTLNDTKSDYVMNVKNGILYRAYKVKTNTLSREVKNL